MAHVSLDEFSRTLVRCAQINGDSEAHPDVKSMYEDVLLPPATTYQTAYSAFTVAEDQHTEAQVAVSAALARLDAVFRIVRSSVGGRLPNVTLPGTLKEQDTDTDRLTAVQRLQGIVQDHRGTPWADGFLAGEFGVLAPDTIAKLEAVEAAANALESARKARSDARAAAWPAFLSFKDTVLQAHGSTSRFYRRISSHGSPAAPTPPTPEPPVVVPSPAVTPDVAPPPTALMTPTNGAH